MRVLASFEDVIVKWLEYLDSHSRNVFTVSFKSFRIWVTRNKIKYVKNDFGVFWSTVKRYADGKGYYIVDVRSVYTPHGNKAYKKVMVVKRKEALIYYNI